MARSHYSATSPALTGGPTHSPGSWQAGSPVGPDRENQSNQKHPPACLCSHNLEYSPYSSLNLSLLHVS